MRDRPKTSDPLAAVAKRIARSGWGRPVPKAWAIPRRDRNRWLRRQQDRERPCEYGHLGCSADEGGACSNELLHLIDAEQADPDDPDDPYAHEGDAGRGARQTTGEHLGRRPKGAK